jgi:hypothetical protein
VFSALIPSFSEMTTSRSNLEEMRENYFGKKRELSIIPSILPMLK